MAAYAFYQENAYDEAINALDRFIELHPGSPDAAYAYYLKAISYYEQIVDVRRDQKMTSEALNALEELVRRFPDSRSEEHTSELQSLMRISYAVFCLKKKKKKQQNIEHRKHYRAHVND